MILDGYSFYVSRGDSVGVLGRNPIFHLFMKFPLRGTGMSTKLLSLLFLLRYGKTIRWGDFAFGVPDNRTFGQQKWSGEHREDISLCPSINRESETATTIKTIPAQFDSVGGRTNVIVVYT